MTDLDKIIKIFVDNYLQTEIYGHGSVNKDRLYALIKDITLRFALSIVPDEKDNGCFCSMPEHTATLTDKDRGFNECQNIIMAKIKAELPE